MRSKHPFRAMCSPVNVYCDRDISCMVIVTYHVLISVLLVPYVVSIQCIDQSSVYINSKSIE